MTREKWVLVTGAASGIGKATALLLAGRGFGVYATDVSGEDLNDLGRADGIEAIRLDITSDPDVRTAFDSVTEKGTGLFALVNNAGIFNPGPLMVMPMERFEKQYAVNVFGTQRITKAFFPLLLKSKGRNVNMSSVAGYVATPFSGPYASSKHALEGWSDALRRELIPLDVKVTVIEPALINTPLWNGDLEGRIEQYRGSVFYEANRRKLEHETAEAKDHGIRPEKVADAVYQALTVPKPKTRYLVSNQPILHGLLRFFPDTLLDRLVVKEF